MTTKPKIATARAEAVALAADLQRQIVELAGKTSDPNDPRLAELDAQLEAAQASIRRADLLSDAQRRHQTAAAQTAKIEDIRAAHKEALRIAQARLAIAERMDRTIQALGSQLAEWAELGVAGRAAAHLVHKNDTRQDWDYHILHAASGDHQHVAVALQRALFNAGVGAVGISAPFDINRPFGEGSETIAEAAEFIAEKLGDYLAQSIARTPAGAAHE